jgi:uncharacterized protein (TIGR04255 family)
MTKFPHLARAPVVEALVDFRVRPSPAFDVKIFEDLNARLKDRYPTIAPIREFLATIGIEEGKPSGPGVVETHKGFRFEGADSRLVVMMTADGCTISRLKPYETWEKLIEEARLIWELYVSTVQPEAVIRVATRFINRVEIPLPLADFDEYLTSPPQVPKNLPQYVSEFLSRMVINDPNDGITIVLTQALEPILQTSSYLPVLLDIDVFKGDTYEPRGLEIWKLLERFRDIKNETFFASLTPKALEMLV